jgi:outer membrane protein assembly factor BamD
MVVSRLLRGGVLALCIALAAVPSCRSKRDIISSNPELLYKRAHQSLNAYDFDAAIKTYEALTARFPFTDQARQARLDLVYAYYRAGESESAIDAAEQFVRENPTHPRVDYVWYIRGLVDFERTPNALERLFRVDLAERPPTTARKAFASFRTVVEKYPKSEYAHDARKRMIFLRNRLADYETHVAQYYLKRGAYVAAAQRAKGAIEQYDGAPAVRAALATLIAAYDRLNLQDLSAQARQVYEANYGSQVEHLQAATRKAWWKFW